MNTNNTTHTSEVRAEQVTNQLPEAIYLGVDLHKATISLTRIVDHGTPQPAQKFNWSEFWKFAEKQRALAKKIYAVYEAGAFGFWPARRLQQMGLIVYVVHPEKLDPRHKKVQTDRLDSRHLADKLQRHVLGNRKAMVTVSIPTEAQERARLEARHRQALAKERQRLIARGQGLLLSQGIFTTKGWWRPEPWQELQPQLCAELARALNDDRDLVIELNQRLRQTNQALVQTAPVQLPVGFGKLTWVLLLRELCTYQRFGHRRGIGGFTGQCGGVSASGGYHADLSINKAGSPYLRTLLIELAWRVVYWQPDYQPLQRWKQVFGPEGKARQRKSAIVALAHQLMVDLWRWQTGRTTPQALGLKLAAA
jgi:transposase